MTIFSDRAQAGQQLAKLLIKYKDKPHTIILALPRGGVNVAFEIAKNLQLPLEVFIVRKIGAPSNKELAIGAIAENDVVIFNNDLIHTLHIKEDIIQSMIESEQQELQRRRLCYRHGNDLAFPKDAHIILVDDGIATGATTKAAISALRQFAPQKITLAVPVAPLSALTECKVLVEELICAETPEPFYGVGMWYDDFPQVSDSEVTQLLSDAREFVKN